MTYAHYANYPDLFPIRTQDDAYKVIQRDTFRVGGRLFQRQGNDAYTDGKIIAYQDQQDSTSWGARSLDGRIHVRYYWAPEYAVEALLNSASDVLRT